MKLKTYTAGSMAQALARVREDLGTQAVIVHTRSYQKGAWFGFGGKPVVEITASSEPDAVAPKRGFDAPDRRVPAREVEDDRAQLLAALGDAIASRAPEATHDEAPSFNDVYERERTDDRARIDEARVDDVIEEPVAFETTIEENVSAATDADTPDEDAGFSFDHAIKETPIAQSVEHVEIDPHEPAFPDDETIEEQVEEEEPIWSVQHSSRPDELLDKVIGKEVPEPKDEISNKIASLERMMSQVLESTRRTDHAVSGGATGTRGVGADSPITALHASMVDNEVPISFADEVSAQVTRDLDADELRNASVVRHALLGAIASRVRTCDSIAGSAPLPEGRPGVVALIGPTGVGKTTTIAKLAARAKLRAGRRVALITSDTYRIGAVEQLRTYAEIVGLELGVANAPEEMREQLDRFSGSDLIVLDTAGRSQHNGTRLDELEGLLDAAAPDETHLVLSTTVTPRVLGSISDRFSALGATSCVLTKLDECVTSGVLASIGEHVKLPIGFLAVGQEVPDDLIVAKPARVARCILDGPDASLASMREPEAR